MPLYLVRATEERAFSEYPALHELLLGLKQRTDPFKTMEHRKISSTLLSIAHFMVNHLMPRNC